MEVPNDHNHDFYHPLEKFHLMLSKSDSLFLLGNEDKVMNDDLNNHKNNIHTSVPTSPLSMSQLAFVHENLLDAILIIPNNQTHKKTIHHLIEKSDLKSKRISHEMNDFILTILGLNSVSTSISPTYSSSSFSFDRIDKLKENYELLVSTLVDSGKAHTSPNRILMTYQFLLRCSQITKLLLMDDHNGNDDNNNKNKDHYMVTVLQSLSDFALPLLFGKAIYSVTNNSNNRNIILPYCPNIQVRDAFMEVLMSPISSLLSSSSSSSSSSSHKSPNTTSPEEQPPQNPLVKELISKCALQCSTIVHQSLFLTYGNTNKSNIPIHIVVETACRILVRLLDLATTITTTVIDSKSKKQTIESSSLTYRDIVLDEMQNVFLNVIHAVAYQHVAYTNSDDNDGENYQGDDDDDDDDNDDHTSHKMTINISYSIYSSVLLRPITGVLLPKLFESDPRYDTNSENIANSHQRMRKRLEQLWNCLLELFTISSSKSTHIKSFPENTFQRIQCRQWNDLAPTIVMGVLCTENVLKSILPIIMQNKTTTNHDMDENALEILFQSILSCLCRYGTGSMGGRMQTNKGPTTTSSMTATTPLSTTSSDNEDQIITIPEDVQSRDAIDQILRRRAIYVLRLIIEFYVNAAKDHSYPHDRSQLLSRADELANMLQQQQQQQQINKGKKKKKTNKANTANTANNDYTINLISIWKKFIICYETLEMEGEQHLIDPIFPVLKQLSSVIDIDDAKNDDNYRDDEDTSFKRLKLKRLDDNLMLPCMTWNWIGALLTRVFLSATPTVRKLALYRFFSGDAGIQMPITKAKGATGLKNNINSNGNDNSRKYKSNEGVPLYVIEESYLPLFLQSYDSLSSGGGIGTIIQFENDVTGKVQSEDITPLVQSFLVEYVCSIGRQRQASYLKYLLSEDCILKLRTKTVTMIMNSLQLACLSHEQNGDASSKLTFYVTGTDLDNAFQAWKKLLSTGGVIPAMRKSLLEAFAVFLAHCSYGREKNNQANHLLVLRLLTLFPTSVNNHDGNTIIMDGSNVRNADDKDEKNLTDSSLQTWLCNLGTLLGQECTSNESSTSSWSEIAGAACASSFVQGHLLQSNAFTSATNNPFNIAMSTQLEREMGAAIAKLCAFGTAKSENTSNGASSLLWPAIHRGLKGVNADLPRIPIEISSRAMRAVILLEFGCIEKVIGGMGNGEMLFLSSPLPNGEKREIMSPPPPSIETILHVACFFLTKEIQNVTLLESDQNTTTTVSGASSRNSTANMLSLHFSQLITQLMSLRFAFPSSVVISEICDEILQSSLHSLTMKKSVQSQYLVRHAALVYAALSCWAELGDSSSKLGDACDILLSMEFNDNLEENKTPGNLKNVEQASRSIFQYAKWGALSLLVPKINDDDGKLIEKGILEQICEKGLDSVNATPQDALLPLFDCCTSALKLYTEKKNIDAKSKTQFSTLTMNKMVRTLFAVLHDTSNSRTRMHMLNQICLLLFRPSLLTWEYETGSETIQNAFQDLMSMAGTKRPHIAKTVISRIVVAWLGKDGTGKPAIPYRKDIVDLLVYKECRTDGGVASAYQEEQEAQQAKLAHDVDTERDFKLPDTTHELSVVRGFILLFISKLPQDLPSEVITNLIHWIIINIFETICNKPGNSTSLMTGSAEYCRRMRSWQALCLLSRYVSADIAAEICDHVFECLGTNMHGQIRYFCEIFTIRCTKMHPKCFGERLIKEINRVDLTLQQVASLMIICGNLIVGDVNYSIPFMQSGIPLHKILAGAIPWLSSTQGFSRAIAQLLVHELIPLVIDVSNADEKDINHWYLRSIFHFLDQNAEMKRLRKKQSKFFSRYAIDSVCTVSGILSIPVDSGDEACPPHMVDIIKRCLEEVYEEAHDLEAPMWKQVEELLISNGSIEQQRSQIEEIDELDVTFQRKILPQDTLNLALERSRDLAARNGAGQRKRPLIVCASLVDKPPNLAGLARTAEIFAADRLVVPDLNVRKMDNFKSISVGAGDWIEMEECKEKDLLVWLNDRRNEGYTIVGLEQTSSSKCISDFEFPERTVILLGKEKEGISVELLQAVDTCVEIPQLGIIRSLNVHVTGALAIWEYVKQRIKANE